jgi:catechol 2,3-dioxygenase-like lactoylglutathione lyase family enzyme
MQPSETDTPVINIHGPIVSSGNLADHLRLFAAFGMEEVGRCDRSPEETAAIWGAVGQSSREITLNTPGTPFGARLVGFDPGSNVQIRQPSRGSDSEALKVIDFYAPDLDAARQKIETGGFLFKDEVADYETPEGRFQEAHLWGPDGVVCALITGDPTYFEDFATVRDRLVSEPQSISGPVRDEQVILDFLKRVFGLGVVHRYGLHDESFQELVGSSTAIRLKAWNVGTRTVEPYFGIINYGLAEGSQTSLFDVARPPARGLLGATLRVRDATMIAGRAGVPVIRTRVPGFGASLTATIRAPNGAWFQAIQSLSEA